MGYILRLALGCSLLGFAISARGSAPSDISLGNAALQSGRALEAVQILQQAIHSQPQTAAAHQLLCRVYYAEDLPDQAIPECLVATSLAPSDSSNQMWLGRAYGLKAEHSGPISGYQIAKKVRDAFERAVQLDHDNVHALGDLGEYYVDAPAFLGGGDDKARALALSMLPRFPAQAHRLLALIAIDIGDKATAESEFKLAISSGCNPEAYNDLAHFYEKEGRLQDALTQIQAGVARNQLHDSALVDSASILVRSNLAPDLAEQLLRQYLNSAAQSDAAPAFRVHVLLGNLLKQQRRTAEARKEYAAALQLAPDYSSARKAMQSLS